MSASAITNSGRGILVVGNFLSVKGMPGACEGLSDNLEQKGWRVTRTSSKLSRLARLSDMLVASGSKRSRYTVAAIEVYSGLAFSWAEIVCLVLRLMGKPYVLTLHGGGLADFARRWPRRVRQLLRSAEAVTTPSVFLQNSLRSVREDILYLPNALDLERYPFRLRANPLPRLCWLRSFHAIYNPTLAVKTLALLAADFPAIKLNMTGPDKGDGSLEAVSRLADELALEENIEITGAIAKSEVPRRMAEYDIFLNTTDYESFGISVMEAAVSGMCIVTTNVGELPYLWKDGHDALLVPPDDAEAMAAAVRRILTEPGLAERLSRNARRKAEQFDWSVILPQWESVLSSVAGEGTK